MPHPGRASRLPSWGFRAALFLLAVGTAAPVVVGAPRAGATAAGRSPAMATLVGAVSGQVGERSRRDPLTGDMAWRNIGPANMSGRISDIEALDRDFTHVVVASASGGVFKSVNAGTTWTPIFEDYGAASIGDVAIFQPDPDIIWVGTGEECVRNSVAWGDGLYRSTDGGATFERVGLENSYTIAKVLTHPEDPETVWVAAGGNPWSYGGQRGIYRTTDGGQSWKQLTDGLPDDDRTGASDLVVDPRDPDVLYAGMWERLRRPWRFDSGGPASGIYKSTDGGDSWVRLTSGLPEGDKGRIGLAVAPSNPDVIMAMVEHGFQPDEEEPAYGDLSELGSGIYRSEDGGQSWELVNRYNNRPFYYSHIWINPQDTKTVYVLAGSLQISTDGGRSLERQSETRIHADHHALWVDPTNPRRFYMGTDGGAALTHDHGATYEFFDNLVLAQYYSVGVDMRDPYWIYGGLQDNGTWGGPSVVRDPNGILTDHWVKLAGGDGFYAQVDPTDWRTVYVESQAGNVRRVDALTRDSVSIRPRRQKIVNYRDWITQEVEVSMVERDWRGAFRFNWNTPMVLSPHNPRTLWLGGNHLLRSVDRGNAWRIVSPDLTDNDPEKTTRDSGGLTPDNTGAEHYGTITTISESPLTTGLLWVGTDDGNVWVTRDGGDEWTEVTANVPRVPEDTWVSRVVASAHDAATAYVAFDGHRGADFRPWVFRTEDYGRRWTPISSDLPQDQPVYAVVEDPENPDLLFLGTEFGVFYTLDRGDSWRHLKLNMPTVAVRDLAIHPRERDLIAGTHGRGIWILDDITPLEQTTTSVLSSEAHLYVQRPATAWQSIRRSDPRRGHQFFVGDNVDTATVPVTYWLGKEPEEDVQLLISDAEGNVHTAIVDGSPGVHRYRWNLRFDGAPMDRRQIELVERLLRERIAAADTDDERQVLERALEDFRAAPTDAHRRRALRAPESRLGASSSRRFVGGRHFLGMGDRAGPGTYRVTMVVGDREYTRTLVVEPDPLLERASAR